MSKVYRITEKTHKLRMNGKIYRYGDDIPGDELADYLKEKDWLEPVEIEDDTGNIEDDTGNIEDDTGNIEDDAGDVEDDEVYNKEATAEDLISNGEGGWYKVVGLDDPVRGKDKAIEKAKEILAEGGE